MNSPPNEFVNIDNLIDSVCCVADIDTDQVYVQYNLTDNESGLVSVLIDDFQKHVESITVPEVKSHLETLIPSLSKYKEAALQLAYELELAIEVGADIDSLNESSSGNLSFDFIIDVVAGYQKKNLSAEDAFDLIKTLFV